MAPTDSPVVFIHGAGMDKAAWMQLNAFVRFAGYETVAVDLPGHGTNPDPVLGSIAEMAQWLNTQIDHPAHLVGHSMGALIAIEAASQVPAASVCLFGVAAKMPVNPSLLEMAKQNNPTAGEMVVQWSAANRMTSKAGSGVSVFGTAMAMMGHTRPGVLFADLNACNEYERAPETFAQLLCPSTIAVATADKMTRASQAHKLAAVNSAAKVTELGPFGHMAILEEPSQCREALLQHLAPL